MTGDRLTPGGVVRNEDDLGRRFREGDRTALRALYELESRRIFTLALRMAGDRTSAEDLTQEVFLKAFERRRQFRGDANLSTWLYRIAVNHCISQLRRAPAGRQFVAGEGVGGSVLPASGLDPGPEERMLAREEQAQVTSALRALSPELRAVIVLKEIKGMGYSEIAGLLGCREGTVASRLFRARERLRVLLKTGRKKGGGSPV